MMNISRNRTVGSSLGSRESVRTFKCFYHASAYCCWRVILI